MVYIVAMLRPVLPVKLYLHHRSDQRNLGMSMKIERSTLDQVKERFEFNKKKKDEEKKKYGMQSRLRACLIGAFWCKAVARCHLKAALLSAG